MDEMNITIKELGLWVRDNAPYSPKILKLDLGNGEVIEWELEPRTGAYILKEKKKG